MAGALGSVRGLIAFYRVNGNIADIALYLAAAVQLELST